MSQDNMDILPENDSGQGEREKYARSFAAGGNIVKLSPDVAEFFPDSQSVNRALRLLIEIAGKTLVTREKALSPKKVVKNSSKQVEGFLNLGNTGCWEGDLDDMRA